MDWVIAAVPLVLFLVALAACGILLEAWRRWVSQTAAPRGLVTVVGLGGQAIFAIGALGTLSGFVKACSAVGAESIEPSQAARIYAEGTGEAMNATFVGMFATCLVIALPCLGLGLRYRGARRSEQ